MKRRNEFRFQRGMTIIELLIVLALAAILTTLAVPVIRYQIYRSRHLGIANETFLLIQRARIEAIKRGVPTVVVADFDRDEVLAFADVNDAGGQPVSDLVYNPTSTAEALRSLADYEIGRVQLPHDIYFWGGGDAEAEGPEAVVGFTVRGDGSRALILDQDGTARAMGAFRFGDRRENYLEVALTQAATARTVIRKYDPSQPPELEDDSDYHPRGGVRPPWEWNY